MERRRIDDWLEAVDRMERSRSAPSAMPSVAELWADAPPDAGTAARLAHLELRHGSAIIALDLATWALDVRGEDIELRLVATAAALSAGLTAAASGLLRPALVAGDRSPDQQLALTAAVRRLALESGSVAGLRRAVLLDPSDPDAPTRLADRCWAQRDQAPALHWYRRALCLGARVGKGYLRLGSSGDMIMSRSRQLDTVLAASRRSGDPRIQARQMHLLMELDDRLRALSMLDGGGAWSGMEEVRPARARMVAYARAQLQAADAEAAAAARENRARDDDGIAGARHQAGRALADAGWHDQAVWLLRLASGACRRT